MPSSSSSDEDVSKFKEAADASLYNDSLFKGKTANPEESSTLQTTTPPSLRYMEEEEDRIHNELRVTPAFQKHVAKHLSKLLDSHLDTDEKSEEDSNFPKQTRSILKAKRSKRSSGLEANSSGGVRLFGASAVFLSNLNIVPAPPSRRKRRRKVARFTSDSDSSSEDSENENMKKMSAAAVSADWILKGEAVKGWTSKKGKVERCVVDKSGHLISVKSDPDTTISNALEKLKIEMKYPKSHVETELADSFSTAVCIGSDSPSDAPIKLKKSKKNKKKKRKKEQYSEDATTETTEVEDIIEKKKKKVKKKKCPKKSKFLRAADMPGKTEELKTEKIQMIDCIPEFSNDGNNDSKRHKHKKKRKRGEKGQNAELFMKTGVSKLSKVKTESKKKLRKRIRHLSKDLAKLMMTPNDSAKAIS